MAFYLGLHAPKMMLIADQSMTANSYANRATDNAIDHIPNLFRCPDPKCNYGQLHDTGDASPIVTCYNCRKRFCFRHKVLWHKTLSCEEYDQFIASPHNFKSRFEMENEKADRQRETEARLRAEREERDRLYAQNLLDEEQREEARRQATRERQGRELRERRERERRDLERKQAEEAKRQMREDAEKKKREEEANLQTIDRTTKNCPRCKWPIEKNGGW